MTQHSQTTVGSSWLLPETGSTALQDKLGARVHLALARKTQGLIAISTKDLQESLHAQIVLLWPSSLINR